MSLAGLVVGWRIHTNAVEAIGGYLLLLVFAYAFSWIMAFVGLKVGSVEVVNNASFMVIFPLTFIANTFVEVQSLPGVLQTFAEWNPVSAVSQAVREAFGNTGSMPPPDVWSLQNPIEYTLIWVGRHPGDLRPALDQAVQQGSLPLTRIRLRRAPIPPPLARAAPRAATVHPGWRDRYDRAARVKGTGRV